MKVKAWVETEVEVDVPVEEAIAELCRLPDPAETKQELIYLLNRCVAALRHVPDAAVAQLEAKARQIVAYALREQALRYDPGLDWARVQSPDELEKFIAADVRRRLESSLISGDGRGFST